MNNEDENNIDESELQKVEAVLRIAELRQRLSQVSNEDLPIDNRPDISLEAQEKFLRHMIALHGTNSNVNIRKLLLEKGHKPFRSPSALRSASSLHKELHRLIEALASIHFYLHHTNHLTDAELYRLLTQKLLKESSDILAEETQASIHCDVSDFYEDSQEGVDIYLSYYADEMERQEFLAANPEWLLPPVLPCPSNRDELLPRPPTSDHSSDEDDEDYEEEDDDDDDDPFLKFDDDKFDDEDEDDFDERDVPF